MVIIFSQTPGGGFVMYIKSNLVFSRNLELSVMNEKNLSHFFVNVFFKNKSIICGTIYRTRRRDNSSFESFNKNRYNIMKKMNKAKHKCVILGDFNFDLLDSSDQLAESFTASVFSFNYYPLINKPTRITENKHSAIDHIWTVTLHS